MANEYMGWVRRLHIAAAESTWGTINGTPAYRYLPYESYDVRMIPEYRSAAMFTGYRQRRHNVKFRERLDGTLVAPLFGYQASNVSLAELLVAWAFNAPTSQTLESRTIELYDSLEVKRHLGLRVNTATISGSASSGNVSISLGLMGQDEASVSAGSAQALSATVVPENTEFLFPDVTFTLASVATTIEAFSITINNNLKENFLNSQTRSLLDAGQRTVDMQFVLKHNATTRDALLRAAAPATTDASLVIKGLHGGTGSSGTYSQCTMAFDNLSFGNMGLAGGLNDHIVETVDYLVLKPATTDNDIDFTWANS